MYNHSSRNHLSILSRKNTKRLPESLRQDWKDFGPKNFKFIVLELGPAWSERKKRVYTECRYIIEHHENNKEVYNDLTERILVQLNTVKETMYSKLSLNYLNENITHFTLPGIYTIENKITKKNMWIKLKT